MPEIRAWIFDMDGVLVDSNPLHRQSWQEYNRRQGIDTTEAMHRRMYGKRNDQIVRDFLGAQLTDAQVFAHGAAKEKLYREMLLPVLEATLVNGLRGFLARHSTVPKAIATNAEPPNVEFVLQRAGLASFFQFAVDGHQVAHPKPAPDVYLRAAELLKVDPAHCVVFEDSHGGVQAGLAAGMRVVGISTTFKDLAGVEFSVPDFNDPLLEKWLQEQL